MVATDIEERRDRLQITMFAGITAGSGGLALQELCKMIGLEGAPVVVLALLSLIGWLVFAIATIRMTRIAKAGGTGIVLEDERRDQLRAESLKFGFVGVMAVQCLALMGDQVLDGLTALPLTVSFVATLSIAVGVIAGLGRFVYLNR
ncbi:MAG: hypothetical protein AAF436_18780 [Myxococcota bacterium]